MSDGPIYIGIAAHTIGHAEAKEALSQSAKACGSKAALTGEKDGRYVAIVRDRITASIFQGVLSAKGAKHRELSDAEAAALDIRVRMPAATGSNPLLEKLRRDPEVYEATKQAVLDLLVPKSRPFGGSNFTTGNTF